MALKKYGGVFFLVANGFTIEKNNVNTLKPMDKKAKHQALAEMAVLPYGNSILLLFN